MISPNESDVFTIIQSLGNRIFTLSNPNKLEITVNKLPCGVWNDSLLVRINSKKFVFKFYSSSNLSKTSFQNSGSDEYLALQIGYSLGIAPKPVLFDDKRINSKYEYLIYEYVEGDWMQYTNYEIIETAKNFALIHSFKLASKKEFNKQDENINNLDGEINQLLSSYNDSDNGEKIYFNKIERIFHKLKKNFTLTNISYQPAIIHTDPVPSNIIVGDHVFFIDWQSPKIGDPAFDVWAFTSSAFTLWDYDFSLTDFQKELFIDSYLRVHPDKTITERVKLKAPLYLLQHAIHWSLQYNNFTSGKIPDFWTNGRKHRFSRYKRLADYAISELESTVK